MCSYNRAAPQSHIRLAVGEKSLKPQAKKERRTDQGAPFIQTMLSNTNELDGTTKSRFRTSVFESRRLSVESVFGWLAKPYLPSGRRSRRRRPRQSVRSGSSKSSDGQQNLPFQVIVLAEPPGSRMLLASHPKESSSNFQHDSGRDSVRVRSRRAFGCQRGAFGLR